MSFLCLGFGDSVQNAKTIRLFRDTLTKADAIREILDLFNQQSADDMDEAMIRKIIERAEAEKAQVAPSGTDTSREARE